MYVYSRKKQQSTACIKDGISEMCFRSREVYIFVLLVEVERSHRKTELPLFQ